MKVGCDLFESKDLYLSAFLKAKGIELKDAVRQGSLVVFYFKKTRDLEKTVTGFFNGDETISANKFVGSIKDLKSLVHNI